LKAPSAILSKQEQTNAYSFAHALHQYSIIKKGIKVYDRTDIKHRA
jgi:hypothetical protein